MPEKYFGDDKAELQADVDPQKGPWFCVVRNKDQLKPGALQTNHGGYREHRDLRPTPAQCTA